MKKIVNLLTVLTLFTTTTINVIGCETSQKNLIISKQPDLRDEILSLTTDSKGTVYARTDEGEIYKKVLWRNLL
ncbi:hypothetical protein [Spiroplasma sp. AdecLV25b]|uniref:hypothetical protein n=1 Tax=Spiroplasma sp. AdecLV25b TaxID=3027162 RepID=UPI0027DF7B01|nr:hypothetical protein [Spiroplasma sp. AdecLV25b]